MHLTNINHDKKHIFTDYIYISKYQYTPNTRITHLTPNPVHDTHSIRKY